MGSEKKSFIIRVDAGTLAAIEKWAADEFRSTNGQIEWILSEALKRARRQESGKQESMKAEQAAKRTEPHNINQNNIE